MRFFAFTIFLIAGWVTGSGQPTRPYLRDIGKGVSRNIVYIDRNTHSKYYEMIGNFSTDQREYKDCVKSLKGKSTAPLPKIRIGDLPKKWCPVEVYAGALYMYSPSDYGNNYRVMFNDTTCTEFYSDGLVVSQILSIKKLDDITYTISRKGADKKVAALIVHIVNKKGVTVFESPDPVSGRSTYEMMVPANKIRQFPIIVNYCKNNKVPEYPFGPVNYKGIIEDSKLKKR